MRAYTAETDVLFFDVETTGLPPKGAKWENDFEQFPDIVQISWSIGDKEKDYIIKPEGWDIPAEAAAIHGITTEIALEKGTPFTTVIDEFLTDAEKAPLICAHNIYFDTSMIKANVLHYCGKQYYDEMCERQLDKAKRIDTMYKTIKFVGALYANGRPGKFPKLEELHEKLFPGETFDAHNALADVRALRRCLPELVKLELIELKIKEYPAEPAEQSTFDFKKAPETPKQTENKIEINDTEKVVAPGANGENIPETNFEKAIAETAEPIAEKKTNPLLDDNEF